MTRRRYGLPRPFQARIAGIPCLIQATHVLIQRPLGPNCDSDFDAVGYEEIEYSILDSRGRQAAWLARKLTSADDSRVCAEILDRAYAGD